MSDDNIINLQRRMIPEIRISGGALHEYAAEAEAVLADDIYLRGGQLVRIGRAVEMISEQDIERVNEQAVIILVNRDYLRRELTRRARFQVYARREKKWYSIDCPGELAANILNVAESKHWRPLTAIARAPFLRSDMSVCEQAGYDAASGIYLDPSQSFPPIPSAPTREDAERALALLLAPFDQFPFQDKAGKSVFASHVLTSVMRPALRCVPIYFYTAPEVATGKTLLCKAANLIAAGNMPAMHAYSDEHEEQRKVIFASLLVGDSALTLDNVPTGSKVRSSALCTFATAEVYSDRKLGTSDTRSIINTLLVSITGNNINPAGDLARRSLVCRLDADAESARGRTFKIEDLVGHVRTHRGELLVAAITIIRAYAIAEQPKQAHPLESFERWSCAVRDPLLWLGMADPVATQESETEDDHDALAGAFLTINDCIRAEHFTSRDIATVAARQIEGEALRSTLGGADCSDPTDPKKIGYWLRANRDKRAAGFKLISISAPQGSTVWKLKDK